MRLAWKFVLVLWSCATVFLALYHLINWRDIDYRRTQRELTELLSAQQEVLSIYVTGYSVNAELDLTLTPYMYRVYTNGELVRWSDNKSLPAYSLLRQQDSVYFLEHVSGKYIVQRRSVQREGEYTEFFSVLQLEENFQITNNYLQPKINGSVFSRQPKIISRYTDYPIYYGGREIFGIVPAGEAEYTLRSIGIWLLMLGLPFAMVALLYTWDRRYPQWRVMGSVGLLVLVRTLLWYFDFPGRWLDDPIFDLTLFNSYFLNFTLGDVFLNYAFMVVIALRVITLQPQGAQTLRTWVRVLGLAFAVWLVYVNILLFNELLGDLMANSQIEFDLTKSIFFDYPRAVAFIVVLLGAVFYFLVNHGLVKWIAYLQVPGGLYLLFHVAVVAIFLNLFPDVFALFFIQFAWYWIVYLSDLSLRFNSLRRISLEYLLSVAAMLSLVFAYAIFTHHKEAETEAKLKFANRLVLEKDVLGEFYLNEILEQIRRDPSIQERLSGGVFARQNIRERIRRQFVSSYFDKYELQLTLFGPDGDQLDDDGEAYESHVQRYARPEFQTDYVGIYLVNDSENVQQRKYACFLKMGNEGYLLIILNRKRNTPTSVFPELLVESKYEQESLNTYDYTIYRDSTVLYGQGAYGHTNFLTGRDLQNPNLYEGGMVKVNRHFLGLNTQDGRTIVIVSPHYPNRNWVVNFSFLFLLLTLLISVTGLYYRIVLHYRTLTLANKIQVYLAMGFLIPLFVTGFALLNTLNTSYRNEITRNYLKKSLSISENLVDATIRYTSGTMGFNAYSNYVGDVSGFVQSDLNIYSTDGRLITTSQPGIFGLNLLSDRINPVALNALTNDNQNVIIDESIGKLDYKTTYTTITGYSDGQLYAILALPFFDSKNHLRQQQREVLADLLIIFALIFLVALISGNYILQYLIGPLRLVSDHMKRTTLEDDNQPIDYHSDDEIGVLVKEYNQMLVKLERNKEALARSQKESAWKEIARQVAHEIKNPLTPMRLKIQQMMRDVTDVRQRSVLESLITQIDSLSHIADSFSEFAKMPAPINSEFDLRETVLQSIQLHRGPDVLITADLLSRSVIVWADPTIMARIFNNLILNAIQSVKDKQAMIHVAMRLEENKVVVSIRDNGEGVPEGIRDKIFTTYFSTKSSGSGIGLAVAKKGIENAGGHIWFETTEGEGTTFYISLPVYEGS